MGAAESELPAEGALASAALLLLEAGREDVGLNRGCVAAVLVDALVFCVLSVDPVGSMGCVELRGDEA